MRDPELVSCAQRAADELERAWVRWREARGLAISGDDGIADSVASYVAHSIQHPWGRPRVVLGLDAADARELAALLLHGQDAAASVRAPQAVGLSVAPGA
ncbi:hypothetical protein [Sphaerimonospora mesophila]|uniref:hypothetical protein n=1 Tax=Sphaerimonospora mesophila TaxID=37483 RepID=UPI0006E22BF8